MRSARSDGHGHAHGRGHAHGADAARRSGARHAARLWWSLALVASVLVVEAVGAVVTGSLALLSDAGHMLTDVVGLGMALAAIHFAGRGADRRNRSFGLYRLEILAALANAVLLFGVAGYVIVEAIGRIGEPATVPAGPVGLIAGIGLAANVAAFALLRQGAAESLNVRGAYLEVVADLVGSLVVLGSAAVIAMTQWAWVDAAAGAALGLWILPRASRLAGQALRVLLQAAPAGVDLGALEDALASVPGVVDVHDVHVWTLTSDMEVATAHVMVSTGADTHAVLDQARVILAEGYGISHATLQVEPDDHTGCDEVNW